MTATQQAKELGLKSLPQVRDMLGKSKSAHPKVSLQMLDDWSKNKPELFQIVLLGCVELLRKANANDTSCG